MSTEPTETIRIVDIQPSHVKRTRYTVTLNTGKKYSFGLANGKTYIDHHDWSKRTNYRTRHYASPKEKPLLEQLVPSPSARSYYILWGPHTNVQENIQYLNRLWSVRKTRNN